MTKEARTPGGPPFLDLTDIASARGLGGLVLGANDEFFAPKENLLLPAAPVWKEGEYTDRGKWMDGWETRRRRKPGHDWCVLKLGLPGVIRGVVVDTAFFRGNYPEHCSIEATVANVAATFDELEASDTVWTEILPKSALAGDSKNVFPIDSAVRWTHLRLHIYPDGGVARLRVHAEVSPPMGLVAMPGAELDLAAMENGGLVLQTSDDFFGHRENLIAPGRGHNMSDGWETKRRRGPGFDWAVLKLGVPGSVRRVEVDTNHFKGNYPDTCALEGCLLTDGATPGADQAWTPILGRQKLQAHTRHHYAAEIENAGPFSHLRFSIFPDGGVGRLRVWGTPSDEGRRAAGVARIDGLPADQLEHAFLRCCGSGRWAKAMAAARPFRTEAALIAHAERTFDTLETQDWLDAFAAHPRIGDANALREKAKGWEAGEQSGAAGATEDVLKALLDGNREYEKRFGHIFLVCATGKTAAEMLENLRARLANTPKQETENAANEQRAITRLRLAKLLAGNG